MSGVETRGVETLHNWLQSRKDALGKEPATWIYVKRRGKEAALNIHITSLMRTAADVGTESWMEAQPPSTPLEKEEIDGAVVPLQGVAAHRGTSGEM